MQKTVTHFHVLSCLEEGASLAREMIYIDAILFLHCLLPDVHLGFRLLLLRYSESGNRGLCTIPVGSAVSMLDHWAPQGVFSLERASQ